jgi:hypothetical protein
MPSSGASRTLKACPLTLFNRRGALSAELQEDCNDARKLPLKDMLRIDDSFRINAMLALQGRYNAAFARFDSPPPAYGRDNAPSMITLQWDSSTRFDWLLQERSGQHVIRKNEGIETVPVYPEAGEGPVAISAE